MPNLKSFLKPIRQIRLLSNDSDMSSYDRLRESLRILVPYQWRRLGVNLFRGFLAAPFIYNRILPLLRGNATEAVIKSSRRGDFYESVTLLPHIPHPEIEQILNQPVRQTEKARPDIICFSIIEWSFRYQRPQQLMSQFAADGHRVFYIKPSRFLSTSSNVNHFSATLIKKNILEIEIPLTKGFDIHQGPVEGENLNHALLSLDDLRRRFNINDAISYIMIPFWHDLAMETKKKWDWRVVYDCMDDWDTFPGINKAVTACERSLSIASDLVVVTARRLFDKLRPYNPNTLLVRNAADFRFYEENCRPNDLLHNMVTPIIGYFGAIADWFDIELMVEVARLRPQYTFILVGGIFDVDISELRALSNVRLPGQKPYEAMPQYLYHFDVCLIPFKINPVTEATDPVKLYEYLSGGKPVVSVRLPELEDYKEYLYLADTAEEFAGKIDQAISENAPDRTARYLELASRHTWEERCRLIETNLKSRAPLVSIIIVTFNNLALSRLCLESLLRSTDYSNYEVIVVDNNSSDETRSFLTEISGLEKNLKIILNDVNYGFAKANNQGLEISSGDYLVLLNNDTIVPPGWLSRLVRHLQDPQVGMVGPLTNFVGNESKIKATYRTWAEMEEFSQNLIWVNDLKIADIHMLAMFCVAMRRDVFEQAGPLDEQFGIGMFEDDDYSLRIKRLGYRLICAADCFVHHFGQAAFGKLINEGRYDNLFNENRARFENKWQLKWTPHQNVNLEFNQHDIPRPPTLNSGP